MGGVDATGLAGVGFCGKTKIPHLYICINMAAPKERVSTSVSLPTGLVDEIDRLVEMKVFGSRSEALRYGARLAVLFQNRVHARAEDYAYDEAKKGLRRGKSVS